MSWKDGTDIVRGDLYKAYEHINDVIFRCGLEQEDREDFNKIRIGIAKLINVHEQVIYRQLTRDKETVDTTIGFSDETKEESEEA
ncbi:hypothetical protein AAU59_14025 [Listeria monocytogenes]|nr:hypothetical protein [Listeria monocytogenes]